MLYCTMSLETAERGCLFTCFGFLRLGVFYNCNCQLYTVPQTKGFFNPFKISIHSTKLNVS